MLKGESNGTDFMSHPIICTRQASETEEQPGQSRSGACAGGGSLVIGMEGVGVCVCL